MIYALFSGSKTVLYASFRGEYEVYYVLKFANTLVNLLFLFHFLERNTVIYALFSSSKTVLYALFSGEYRVYYFLTFAQNYLLRSQGGAATLGDS